MAGRYWSGSSAETSRSGVGTTPYHIPAASRTERRIRSLQRVAVRPPTTWLGWPPRHPLPSHQFDGRGAGDLTSTVAGRGLLRLRRRVFMAWHASWYVMCGHVMMHVYVMGGAGWPLRTRPRYGTGGASDRQLGAGIGGALPAHP